MKKLLFIMTGGTIASVDNGNGLEPGKDNFFKPILQSFSCDVDFLSPFLLDSSQVQPSHWAELARLIDKNYKSYDGIVVTHGTDTMAYTAAGLSFMLSGIPCPVILTGSQLPMIAVGTDARENIRLAVQSACRPLHGVYVAFHGRLMHGDACSKIYSENFIGFESIGASYIAPEQIIQANRPYRLRTDYHADVFLLKMVPTLSPEIIDQLMALGYRGILIEAYGKGGIPFAFLPAIKNAVEHGVKIGVTTQCTYDGSDCYVYKIGRELLRTGVRDYQQHPTEYALAHMMFQ